MLVIRLQRVGKKHQPSFRIVLQDSKWKPQGKVLELLGFYNPISKEKQFQQDRIRFWISKGAQPSPTLHNMFVDAKIIEGEKIKTWKPKKGKEGAKPKSESKKEATQIASDATGVVESGEKSPASPKSQRGEEEVKSEPEQEAQPEEQPTAA